MIRPMLVVLFAFGCIAISHRVSAQCPGQIPPNCNCQVQTQKNLTICIAGTDYTIVLYTCEQDKTATMLVADPCTFPTCTGLRQDKISWIKQICFPSGAPTASVTAIYNAIICATDLCANDYLGVKSSFPSCDQGTNACGTSLGVYCHTLAFPQCVQRSSTCISVCDADCDQYCYVQRRYCIVDDQCTTCDQSICTDPDTDVCQGSCLDKVDCSELSFHPCCP